MSAPRVIYIDDDPSLRLAVGQALELAGFAVAVHGDASTALASLDRGFTGVVVSDIRMPHMDGFQLLAAVRALDADLPVILVTGHGDIPMAIAALRQGAFDFLAKPFATEHLALAVERAAERRALVVEHRHLQARLAAYDNDSPLIGTSAAITQLRATVDQLAATGLDILVEGETGTGKELVARMLHRRSRRRARPFVAVDCGAIPEQFAEIELFGHAADSVAHSRLARTGRIVAADGGTLLLDNIDAMQPAIQAKLLRVLEEREVQPLGEPHPRTVDIRVIATSRAGLAAAAAQGTFRPDLYYRLSAVRLAVPPLRERGEDRMLLFASFLAEAEGEFGRAAAVLTEAVRTRLRQHDWPGNVRELRNFAIETVLGIGVGAAPVPEDDGPLPARVARFEAAAITDALIRHRGNVAATITALGIPRKTFYDKLARHCIDARRFRARAES